MKEMNPGNAGNDHTYRTGRTNPPKSHRGIIAALLILVILLVSIVTVLGMMNIRLFRLLEAQKDASAVQFSHNEVAEAAAHTAPPEGVYVPALGFTGEEIENLYRSYNEWPQGLYISQVEPDGPAAKADIQPGDILVAIDGVPIAGKEDFQQRTADLQPGHTLYLTVFRDEEQTGELTVPLTATEP